jgi:hypothetical protein
MEFLSFAKVGPELGRYCSSESERAEVGAAAGGPAELALKFILTLSILFVARLKPMESLSFSRAGPSPGSRWKWEPK